MLQIAEHAAGEQHVEHLAIKGPFPRMRQVMNGKAGHDNIKHAEVWQRLIEIVCIGGEKSTPTAST